MKLRLRRPYIALSPLGYPTRTEDCRRILWHGYHFGRMWFLDWFDGVLELSLVRTRQYEPWRLSIWERIRRWV